MDSWAVILQQYAKCTKMFSKEHCNEINKQYFECYDKCLIKERRDLDQFKYCIQTWSNEECISGLNHTDICREECISKK
jgi:hypothetical protein